MFGLIAGLLSNPVVNAVLKTPAVTTLVGKVTGDGTRRISRGKGGVAAVLAIGPDWGELLPAAFSGDWAAVGKLVALAITWAISIWGAGNDGEEL